MSRSALRQYFPPLGVGHPEPTRLDRKPIRPAVRQSEAFHHAREVRYVRRTVVGDPVVTGRTAVERVWPFPGILHVIHVVPKPPEARGVLDVVPRHTAERRMLGDETSHDDAKAFGRDHGLITVTEPTPGSRAIDGKRERQHATSGDTRRRILDETAIVQNEFHVTHLERRQPMGNHEGCPTVHQPLHRSHDGLSLFGCRWNWSVRRG